MDHKVQRFARIASMEVSATTHAIVAPTMHKAAPTPPVIRADDDVAALTRSPFVLAEILEVKPFRERKEKEIDGNSVRAPHL